MRFYEHHFHPSFKLQGKERDDAKVRKTYHKPKTPYERLTADARTTDELRRTLDAVHAGLDPVALLRDIRALQAELVTLTDQPIPDGAEPRTAPSLEQFLVGLRTAWQDGEVRPTARKKLAAKRGRRRPDPLAAMTDTLRGWFEAEPFRTSQELLERLMTEHPDAFTPGQIRTVQRRPKDWAERRGLQARVQRGGACDRDRTDRRAGHLVTERRLVKRALETGKSSPKLMPSASRLFLARLGTFDRGNDNHRFGNISE